VVVVVLLLELVTVELVVLAVELVVLAVELVVEKVDVVLAVELVVVDELVVSPGAVELVVLAVELVVLAVELVVDDVLVVVVAATSYSSVAAELEPVSPPKERPTDWVPQPAKNFLAVVKAPPDDQAVPLYSSVTADTTSGLTFPPNDRPAV
jgi:hypothetical protein